MCYSWPARPMKRSREAGRDFWPDSSPLIRLSVRKRCSPTSRRGKRSLWHSIQRWLGSSPRWRTMSAFRESSSRISSAKRSASAATRGRLEVLPHLRRRTGGARGLLAASTSLLYSCFTCRGSWRTSFCVHERNTEGALDAVAQEKFGGNGQRRSGSQNVVHNKDRSSTECFVVFRLPCARQRFSSFGAMGLGVIEM